MAIKIQGSTIIDDDKNIQDNTGFFSDANNSALRPKSSSGGNYLQRWTGSTWETILFAGNGSIELNRNVNLASGYTYSGDGSGLTNLPVPAFPYNYYFDNSNTAVRANGVVYIQNGNGSDTYATFNSQGIGLNKPTTIGGLLTVNARSNSYTFYADDNNSAVRASVGVFLQNSSGSQTYLYADTNSVQISRNLFLYSVPVGGTTAEPNLKLGPGGGVKIIGSTRRIKENIQYSDFEDICDKIYDLKPAYFTFKNSENSNIDMGLIAEDVNEIFPELAINGYYDDQYETITDENGSSKIQLKKDAVKTPTSVAYERISIIMIGTLKKLRQRVIDLEEEVQTLKASLQTP